jgi:hypothetical protein
MGNVSIQSSNEVRALIENSSKLDHQPWYNFKKETREYLAEINKDKKVNNLDSDLLVVTNQRPSGYRVYALSVRTVCQLHDVPIHVIQAYHHV